MNNRHVSRKPLWNDVEPRIKILYPNLIKVLKKEIEKLNGNFLNTYKKTEKKSLNPTNIIKIITTT